MSWTIHRRHVTKFRPKRALLDSYRFSDTSVEPLTRHVYELRAYTRARTHKSDKYSHRYASVSAKTGDSAWSWAYWISGWTMIDLPSKGQRRNNAITVNSAKEDANDHDVTFMCRLTYIEWCRRIVRNKHYSWREVSGLDCLARASLKGFQMYFGDSTRTIPITISCQGMFRSRLSLEFCIRLFHVDKRHVI